VFSHLLLQVETNASLGSAKHVRDYPAAYQINIHLQLRFEIGGVQRGEGFVITAK
jgi:hypothetical protein